MSAEFTDARLQLVADLLRQDDVVRRSVRETVALHVFTELGNAGLLHPVNVEMKRRIDDLVDDALLHLPKKETA